MKLKLSEMASVAEIIGAFAIVISLVYVGVQLTQNTKGIRAQSYYNVLSGKNALYRELAADKELFNILSQGLAWGSTDVLFSFMALWTFVDVYQSSMMGYMDRSGSLVALLPSVQGFGQFVGPNIAASIIGAGLGYSTMFLVSGSMALVAMVIYGGIFVYMHSRKSAKVEAVAEST